MPGKEQKTKEAIRRALLIVLALVLAITATLAWFTKNKVVDVQTIQLYSMDHSRMEITLYHRSDQAGARYEPVTEEPKLSCENIVPGQVEYYYLELKNKDAKTYQAAVDFLNFKSVGGTPEQQEKNSLLFEQLTLQGVEQDGEATPPIGDGQTFQTLFGSQPGNTSFRLVKSPEYPSWEVPPAQGEEQPGELKIYFQITLPQEAGNLYQGLHVKLTQLAVTLSETGGGA